VLPGVPFTRFKTFRSLVDCKLCVTLASYHLPLDLYAINFLSFFSKEILVIINSKTISIDARAHPMSKDDAGVRFRNVRIDQVYDTGSIGSVSAKFHSSFRISTSELVTNAN